MLTSTRSQIENITPQKAKKWLEQTYSNQRKVTHSKVGFYVDEMRKNRWMPTNVISFALLDGEVHLVNGQHTLHAVVQSGRKLMHNPVVYHEVEYEDDIHNLYAHYDIGKPRTYSDSLRAFGVDKVTGLPLHQINKLSSALVYMRDGFPATSRRSDIAHVDLITLVYEWVNYWKTILEVISPCDQVIRGKILTKPVASVALVTLRHQPDMAQEFWQEVAQINRLRRTDPRLTLHKTLTVMVSYGGDLAHSFRYRPGHFSRAAAYAWNKYYNGVGSRLIKVKNLKIYDPIRILGTPYK